MTKPKKRSTNIYGEEEAPARPSIEVCVSGKGA